MKILYDIRSFFASSLDKVENWFLFTAVRAGTGEVIAEEEVP
jgi:hypothetical protein